MADLAPALPGRRPDLPDAVASRAPRSSGALPTRTGRRRYALVVTALAIAAVVSAGLLLTWANPMPFGTPGFWLIAERRAFGVVVLAIVAVCQALATVSFQTVAANRIVTPSILGFESLYVAIQTSIVYFVGVAGVVALAGPAQFALQVTVMVGLATALYGWLLSGRRADLQVMLLVGIVIGGGLGSVASFMRRLLAPSEFDVLQARLFGSISNADPAHLPVALPLCVGASVLLVLRARRLNALALGRDAALNLGLDHRRETITTLVLVAVLISVSTALVGPLTFLGFLVATLAHQAADTHDHRHVFAVAALIGFVVLAGASFVMNHVFYAQGVVSILIELVGGSVFLFVLLRKGRL